MELSARRGTQSSHCCILSIRVYSFQDRLDMSACTLDSPVRKYSLHALCFYFRVCMTVKNDITAGERRLGHTLVLISVSYETTIQRRSGSSPAVSWGHPAIPSILASWRMRPLTCSHSVSVSPSSLLSAIGAGRLCNDPGYPRISSILNIS